MTRTYENVLYLHNGGIESVSALKNVWPEIGSDVKYLKEMYTVHPMHKLSFQLYADALPYLCNLKHWEVHAVHDNLFQMPVTLNEPMAKIKLDKLENLEIPLELLLQLILKHNVEFSTTMLISLRVYKVDNSFGCDTAEIIKLLKRQDKLQNFELSCGSGFLFDKPLHLNAKLETFKLSIDCEFDVDHQNNLADFLNSQPSLKLVKLNLTGECESPSLFKYRMKQLDLKREKIEIEICTFPEGFRQYGDDIFVPYEVLSFKRQRANHFTKELILTTKSTLRSINVIWALINTKFPNLKKLSCVFKFNHEIDEPNTLVNLAGLSEFKDLENFELLAHNLVPETLNNILIPKLTTFSYRLSYRYIGLNPSWDYGKLARIFETFLRRHEGLENVNLINDDNSDLGATKDALKAIMDQQWNYCQSMLRNALQKMEKLKHFHVSNMNPINKTLIWEIQASIGKYAKEGASVTISDDFAEVSYLKDKWDHVEIKTKYFFKSLK